jgi:hypothetical protein
MPKKGEKIKERERRISMYDPTLDAYREIPESLAKKFVESAKEVEKKLKEAEE